MQMKFLIMNRPNGADHSVISRDPAKIRRNADELREFVKAGHVECLYHLLGGGHMYIVGAKDTDDLMLKLRNNPLYEESHTEVTPIVDVPEFLNWYADHMEKKKS